MRSQTGEGNASAEIGQAHSGALTREHQGCPYPGAHQKEEKERNLFASLEQYSNTATGRTTGRFPHVKNTSF